MKQRFYVTTPIYYVNEIPHIGYAYTTIAADILSRYNRLQGKKFSFLQALDEHGQKVEKAAAEKKRTPKEHADIMVDNFRNLWKRLNISTTHLSGQPTTHTSRLCRDFFRCSGTEERLKKGILSCFAC